MDVEQYMFHIFVLITKLLLIVIKKYIYSLNNYKKDIIKLVV